MHVEIRELLIVRDRRTQACSYVRDLLGEKLAAVRKKIEALQQLPIVRQYFGLELTQTPDTVGSARSRAKESPSETPRHFIISSLGAVERLEVRNEALSFALPVNPRLRNRPSPFLSGYQNHLSWKAHTVFRKEWPHRFFHLL